MFQIPITVLWPETELFHFSFHHLFSLRSKIPTLSATFSDLSVSDLKTSSVKGHFSNDTTLAEMNGCFFHIPESICHITVRINCPPKIPQERMNLDEASLDIPFSLISQVEDNILEAALN